MRKILIILSIFAVYTANLTGQKSIIDLSGKWKFALDASDRGMQEKWFQKNLTDEVELPGSLVDNLKGDDISLTTKFTASIYDSSWYHNPYMAKFRQPGNIKVPFWLTQNKYYVGPAWYQKEIQIPATWRGQEIILFLERVHFTSHIWINGKEVGSNNSLTTAHRFNVTPYVKPGKNIVSICIDNRMKDVDVGANSHSITDHTQGNWNGVVGKIELQAFDKISFDDIQIFPDLKNKQAKIKVAIRNNTGKTRKSSLVLSAQSFNSDKKHNVKPVSFGLNLSKTNEIQHFEYTLPMGNEMLTWDEFDPALYQLSAELKSDKLSDHKTLQFGMREISIEGKYFYINGRKTMLRGTVENALFPLTGYPPMNVAAWERVFRICKAYGLNHMRFHSYCPPEAAFIAADKIGFYLQPEGPSWPNHSTQLGRGLPIDKYLMDETIRLTKDFGNYASFTFLAAGNEPRGNWVPWASQFVNFWKKTDTRRVYTGASVGQSWSWQPANQFHVKAGARGLDWRSSRPESMSDYRQRIDSIKEPYVSHETGQWCVFPNFDEIKKYTGNTRARNFELFREHLADNDMAEMSHEFLMASGHLQALCYKHEIERTLRTPDYAGFQLLSLNDFSGQGTALVGVLDAFWDEKGYMTASEFRRFCSATVPLIRTEKFVYKNNEIAEVEIEFAHFGNENLKNVNVFWKISDTYGNALHKGKFKVNEIQIGSNQSIGKFSSELSEYTNAQKLNLEIGIEGTDIVNDWDFWVYPATLPEVENKEVYISNSLDQKAIETLEKGGKVLLTAAGKIEYGKDVQQYYSPVFWNTSWFKMRPPHTTGVFINHYHPVFKNFVTESWGNMQWWELINRTQTMLLTDFPKGFQPIVQPIDTWFVNRKLAMLFEAKVGNGKLMMTSMDIENQLNERPVAAQLRYSILNYMNSQAFRPEQTVDIQQIKDLYEKTAAPINFFTKGSPDELKQGVR
ncbi:MAG: beta-glucuronidase [Paludibacter sp.]|nr:beta-glucuronidase [Paludibacter sp.]